MNAVVASDARHVCMAMTWARRGACREHDVVGPPRAQICVRLPTHATSRWAAGHAFVTPFVTHPYGSTACLLGGRPPGPRGTRRSIVDRCGTTGLAGDARAWESRNETLGSDTTQGARRIIRDRWGPRGRHGSTRSSFRRVVLVLFRVWGLLSFIYLFDLSTTVVDAPSEPL